MDWANKRVDDGEIVVAEVGMYIRQYSTMHEHLYAGCSRRRTAAMHCIKDNAALGRGKGEGGRSMVCILRQIPSIEAERQIQPLFCQNKNIPTRSRIIVIFFFFGSGT